MATSAFDPSQHSTLSSSEASVVQHITKFTAQYFQNPKFDASHDFNHVTRVVRNAIHILECETKAVPNQELNAFVVILGALLHDVEDKKYVDLNAVDGKAPLAKQELKRQGLTEEDAQRIQMVVEGVSYSSEVKDPARVEALIQQIPELAVVQDADRLDAIGAIGIARCFTFGGAKAVGTLESSVEHFGDKLLKLEGMMKTQTGKKLAAERTERLREFLKYWDNETRVSSH